jgi:hypothetical protein
MLGTLVIVGGVSWMDVRGGNRPDPIVLAVPGGVFTALYLSRKKTGGSADEEPAE